MDHQKIQNDQLNRLNVEEFISSEKSEIILVLDNIRSGNNIGSIFRTADAFRIKTIFICGISAIPPNKEILKTALGATESVNWEYCENGLDAIQQLRNSNTKIFAIEQAINSIPLNKIQFSNGDSVALIFGNEVEGVSQSLINQCDGVIEIPQFGTKHSFNVAVSAGIVIWQIYNELYDAK